MIDGNESQVGTPTRQAVNYPLFNPIVYQLAPFPRTSHALADFGIHAEITDRHRLRIEDVVHAPQEHYPGDSSYNGSKFTRCLCRYKYNNYFTYLYVKLLLLLLNTF